MEPRWCMRARRLHLAHPTQQKLRRLKKEAQSDGAYRVAKRIHAILLSHDGQTSGDIAYVLDAPRSKVSQWLSDYERFGFDALLEGQRSGRPPQLQPDQRWSLEDMVESGPQAYGFLSGVWSAPMIRRILVEEFALDYSVRHVGRLLHQMGFSVQRPKRVLARADLAAQKRWRRYTYPNLKKKPVRKERK